jgi:spore coat protein A
VTYGPINRRRFLRDAVLASTAVITSAANLPRRPRPKFKPALNAFKLARFVDPLPIPPRAVITGHRSSPDKSAGNVPFYRIEMRQFTAQLHRDLKPTAQWGFNGIVPGPTFDIKRGEKILVEWVNSLPTNHLLEVDRRIHGAQGHTPAVRTVVHLHGSKAPPQSDGYPDDWFVPGKSAFCFYPNDQEAAMLWYHDHAIGINRLNIYAGLMGAFFIRDETESALNLPRDDYEIPLIICDRKFDPEGGLYYPVSGTTGAPWVPEFYGDAMLVNGKVFPYLEVQPRKYRFRILNAANARFFALTLSSGRWHQIGTDLGLLAAPVEVASVNLYPAERADVVVDFGNSAGERVVLRHQGIQVMEFRVGRHAPRDPSALPSVLRALPKLKETDAVRTRTLTLVEYNTFSGGSMVMLLNDAHWSMPVTEKPVLDTVEVWNLVNLTEDAHPIHLHLVRMQILDRRPFDDFAFNAKRQLRFTGPQTPPDAGEAGWKDTVRCDPGVVTRVIARFEGYTGRYVWHCHILEHEDNEMMRPFEVISAAQAMRDLLDPPKVESNEAARFAEWCKGGRLFGLPRPRKAGIFD